MSAVGSVVTTYVSPLAEVRGEVQFSEGCVVLPYARIVAGAHTRLTLGPYCLVEEYAVIVCDDKDSEGDAMSIGPCNHFKTRCTVRNVHRIGRGNVFESFARIVNLDSSSSSSTAVHGDVIENDVVVTPHVCIVFDKNKEEGTRGDEAAHSVLLPAHTVALLADEGMSWQLVPRRGTASAIDTPSAASEGGKAAGERRDEGEGEAEGGEERVKKLCRWYLQQLPALTAA